ncbi:MAG: EAL domain-containing protein [Alphaproteobacteria bacterium]|nr:EAL domain-containing protein [Alphaproteobacteria bacterium]
MIAVLYLALAAAGGVAASYFQVAPAPTTGVVIAALAVALHITMAQRGRARALERRVRELTHQVNELQGETKTNRAEIETLRVRVDDLPDAEKLSNELRVLQGLLKQLSERKDAAGGGKAIAAPKTKDAAPVPRDGIVKASKETVPLSDSELLDAIETGLREERVELYLQPVVSLPQRKRRFYECFSRITTPAGSVITPEQYIPVAEREGLVDAIDNLLLVRCVQLVRRARRDHLDVGFFCNISNASLTDVDFFQDFIAFMAENRPLAETLIFEFDQASIASENYDTRLNLQRLRGCGYRFSLDQVTDMNLNLEDLAEQGFRYIKVNAHMLHELARGDTPVLDMRAFKGALDRNAMDLIVEKIESEEMLLDLLELRVDFGQGYLFGEPRPIAQGG